MKNKVVSRKKVSLIVLAVIVIGLAIGIMNIDKINDNRSSAAGSYCNNGPKTCYKGNCTYCNSGYVCSKMHDCGGGIKCGECIKVAVPTTKPKATPTPKRKGR
jgi:hypothetical protein